MQKIGGAELQAYYIAQELLRRKWEVFYVCEKRDPKSFVGEKKFNGIEIVRIPRQRHYMRWANYKALERVVKEIHADIWYCRSSLEYPAAIAKLARRWGGRSVWAISHDSQTKILKPRSANAIARIIERFSIYLFVRNIQDIDRVLAQNRVQQENLKKNYGFDAPILYNAHPKPERLQKATTPYGGALVVWIARLQSWKCPEKFIDLAKQSSGLPARYVMVGPTVQEELAELARKSTETLPNFSYEGEYTVDQVNELLQRARVFVNTSLAEGFPNTFIQAWSRGVPVVSMGVDPDELIKRHGLGVVVSNVEEMKAAVSRLVTDDRHWKEHSERCRTFTEDKFSIQHMVDRLLQMVETSS